MWLKVERNCRDRLVALYRKGASLDDHVVQAARLYRESAAVDFCCSRDVRLAFASGMLLPPEFAVLSIKRIWSLAAMP